MAVTSVNTSTFISDTVILIRNNLNSNITDPFNGSRSGTERFVMTSYPEREVKYPIITVRMTNTADRFPPAMQSEIRYIDLFLEIRIWGRNVKEKDTLSQDVINYLRDNVYGASGTVAANLHGASIISNNDIQPNL